MPYLKLKHIMPANDMMLTCTKPTWDNACYPAYCDCPFPNSVTVNLHRGPIPDLVDCRCGEDAEYHSLEWSWHSHADVDALINGPDCTFHPLFSQGTTIVRGDRDLKVGMMHFWEMRILTVLSGTDVMFGIGTDDVDLARFNFLFVSALGSNASSWGFSYNGTIQHNGEYRMYGHKFSQGCIIGVLLDRARGHLEFFLNRRPLGVAFQNIPLDPKVKVYPMVSSTSAKSVIRLMNAVSQPVTLQLRAFRALSKQPKTLEEIKRMPGLRALARAFWFLAPPARYSQESPQNQLDIADEIVLSRLARKHKIQEDDSDDPEFDIYANINKMPTRPSRCRPRNVRLRQQYLQDRPLQPVIEDSDDEFPQTEFCDEYFHFLY